MKTRSSKVISRDTIEDGKNFNTIYIKQELENKFQQSCSHPFAAGNEWEATFKVENSSESSDDLGANIVKCELVQFENDAALNNFSQKHLQTVLLEKIPKTETEILGDDDEPPSSSKEDDLSYNIDAYSNSDSNFDADLERDPFADIDCDPIFSQKPESEISKDSVDLAQSINQVNVNNGLALSSLPTAVASKHIRVHKKIEDILQCQLCLETQSSEIKLKSHVEICAAYHKDRHRFCKQCNFLYRYPHGYKRHAASSHRIQSADGTDSCKLPSSAKTKILGSVLQCQLCMETQSSVSKLKTHLDICAASHQHRRRFCVPCNKLFTQHWAYRAHASGIHGISKEAMPTGYPFKCQFCPSCFALEESLIAHSASKHESSPTSDHHLRLKPFPCLQCTARFKQRGALTFHIKTHTNDLPIKCSVPGCEKAFKLNGALKHHLLRAHSEDKPFKCQELNCDKTFKFRYQLRRHMDSHSEERPFKCPYPECGGMFKNKDKVTKHLAVHTGARRCKPVAERPFKCGQCDRAYRKNYQLTTHVKHAHGNEIFKCPEPYCKTTTKYKSSLKIHLATVHSR